MGALAQAAGWTNLIAQMFFAERIERRSQGAAATPRTA
jgi:hypothetical protein